MSATNALNFIGKLDRREETLIMGALQQRAFIDKLMGNRDGTSVRFEAGPQRVRAPVEGGRRLEQGDA